MNLRPRQQLGLTLLGLIVTLGLVYPMIVAARGSIQLTFFSSSVVPPPPPQVTRVSTYLPITLRNYAHGARTHLYLPMVAR